MLSKWTKFYFTLDNLVVGSKVEDVDFERFVKFCFIVDYEKISS